ncbi:MAG: glutamate racemase [Eubacterium sp.]|nr:glutamate racemase [Eubacterium sp.]
MDNPKCGQPIGVFDSGIGGISVLKELYKIMPGEHYIYFGDSQNAPYGTRPLEEIRRLTIANVEFLLKQGAKGIVVACNTATSAAVRILRGMYPDVPLVGIEPAIKPAALQPGHPTILVMATPMTIQGKKYRNLMANYEAQADIIGLPCPGLVEFVESGNTDGDDLRAFLERLLEPYAGKIDSIVLGCTHYPFVRGLIQEIAGAQVRIFDGGNGTAREMRRRLKEAGLLSKDAGCGSVTFENSLAKEEEIELSKTLFQKNLC